MSDEAITTQSAAPAAKKAPKPKAKPAAKLTKKPAANKAAPAKREPRGFRWTEKRVAIVKAMRALSATDATGGRTAEVIAAKAKLTPQDVKHYNWKDGDLVGEGYVKIAQLEPPTLVYYLTAKGQKADLTIE